MTDDIATGCVRESSRRRRFVMTFLLIVHGGACIWRNFGNCGVALDLLVRSTQRRWCHNADRTRGWTRHRKGSHGGQQTNETKRLRWSAAGRTNRNSGVTAQTRKEDRRLCQPEPNALLVNYLSPYRLPGPRSGSPGRLAGLHLFLQSI